MAKSFYDLDYIIDNSEKRLAEYTVLYQKVLERLTNIILIYSALGIFLIPLVQHAISADITFKRKNSFFNNALVFALLAVVPYIVFLGFHLSKK